jgi:two-component SAPR family response regulator
MLVRFSIFVLFLFFPTLLWAQKEVKTLSESEKKALEDIAKKYFESNSFAKKQELLDQIARYDPISAKDAQWLASFLFQACKIGEPLKTSGR